MKVDLSLQLVWSQDVTVERSLLRPVTKILTRKLVATLRRLIGLYELGLNGSKKDVPDRMMAEGEWF